jgi:hypothetical protein
MSPVEIEKASQKGYLKIYNKVIVKDETEPVKKWVIWVINLVNRYKCACPAGSIAQAQE